MTTEEMPPEGIRTYLIATSRGEMQIDVPESWKITYGPVSPGKNNYRTDFALRIYESDTKQRAIFLDVVSFRDMSIPVRHKIVSESGNTSWETSPDGESSSRAVVRKTAWKSVEENG